MENIETLQVGLQFKIENAKQIEGQAQDLVSKLSGSSVSMTKVSNEAKKTSTGLSKAVSTAKKFAFALLSVRGVWFAIRKSMTMYLAQNEELQTKLNSLYYAVGSMFAPLLEGLVNILAKAVSFINAIVKAMGFAGIDMSNFNKNAGGAAKALQKSLLAIDEINNLQDQQASGGNVGLAAMEFPKIELPEWLKNILSGVGGWLRLSLKGIQNLILDNPLTEDEMKANLLNGLGLIGLGTGIMTFSPGKGILLDLAGLALIGFSIWNQIKYGTKIGKETLNKVIIGGLLASVTGVAALVAGGSLAIVGGGLVLTLAGVVTIGWGVKNLIQQGTVYNLNQLLLEELEKQDLTPATRALYENIIYSPEVIEGILASADLSSITDFFNAIGIESSDTFLQSLQDRQFSNIDMFRLAIIEAGLGTKDEVVEKYGMFGSDSASAYADTLMSTFEDKRDELRAAAETTANEVNTGLNNINTDNIDLSDSIISETNLADEDLKQFIEDTEGKTDSLLLAWNALKTGVVECWQQMESGIKTSSNNILTTVGNMFNGLIKEFNDYCDKLNSIDTEQKEFMGINFTARHISEIEIPQYAIGTNYVPNDQLAYLHKGEAVVPKKFNSSEFFGESSAEELNLLSSINEQLIELNRKDTTINLDSENVARVVSNAQQRLTQRNGNRVFALNR